jgi:AraC-like DNA-binding protein
MIQSVLSEKLTPLQGIMMKPFIFNNLRITLNDAINAFHERGWIVERHRHPWFELNFVSEGYFYTTLQEKRFLTEAGEFLLIPPGESHSHENSESLADDGICLRFQLEELITSEANNVSLEYTDSIKDILSVPRSFSANGSFIYEFISKINQRKSNTSVEVDFMQLLVNISETFNTNALQNVSENNRDKVLAEQVILYLDEYFPHHFKVEELANSLNISYRHLSRTFKHITGVTIIEKLNIIRVNKAKQLLKETDMPIYKIAEATGFENEFYFSTLFKRLSSISPAKFREKI